MKITPEIWAELTGPSGNHLIVHDAACAQSDLNGTSTVAIVFEVSHPDIGEHWLMLLTTDLASTLMTLARQLPVHVQQLAKKKPLY